MKNTIPPITNPLGKYWKQPDSASILLDDTHAVMDAHTFEKLLEYSSTNPSGVYPGKMWKRHADRAWLLVWYGECDDPKMCSNNYRTILVAA